MSDARTGVAVISNPTSGHNRDHFARLAPLLDGAPGICAHRITQHRDDIPKALQEMAGLELHTLAINGGDGTVAAVLGELLEGGHFRQLPRIAILPAGTANMSAGDVGLGGSLPRAVQRLCAWADLPAAARTQRIEQRHMLRLRRGGDSHTHYGMFMGAGAVIHGTEYAHREIHARGLRDDFSLALGTVRTVWGVLRNDPAFSRAAPLQWQLDGGEQHQQQALILALSTLRRLAFGMRPFWSKAPGPLRMTLIEQGCRHFLPNFAAIISGRPLRSARPENGYHSHNGDTLLLNLEGPVNLDGEILNSHGPWQIDTSRALDFVRL